MKIRNETPVGLATLAPVALALGMVALFVWRVIFEGDSVDSAIAYLTVITTGAVSVALLAVRNWRAVRKEFSGLSDGSDLP